MVPALKSIQPRFLLYNAVFVEIFIVGTKLPNGVPRPVVNNTIWHPQKPSAEVATRSFPGAERRLSPFLCILSPYFNTSTTVAVPPFCMQPSDFSSNVVIPPTLFPGDGFS